MKIEDCKPGVLVYYYNFLGVVREEPRQLPDGTWVSDLHEMEEKYKNGVEMTVRDAPVGALKTASTWDRCARDTANKIATWLESSETRSNQGLQSLDDDVGRLQRLTSAIRRGAWRTS